MREIHQNIVLDSKDLGAPARKGSKFCNEGKWENYIEPLLPDGEVFIEYGSNAGMFLKLARKKYNRVIGIERDNNDVAVAEKYRGDDDYKIIHADLNGFDLNTLPLADVTLLSNFHYHQHIDEFRRMLDILEHKTCYVLIVSAEAPQRHWRAQPYREDIMSYFRHWELSGEVKELPVENDPHPRKMFSILFKSPKIERILLSEIEIAGSKSALQYVSGREFARDSINGKDWRTSKYRILQNCVRLHPWSQSRVDQFIEGKYHLARSIASDGLREPLLIDRNGYLVDGIHRYLTLLGLGDSAIVRKM